MEVNQPATSQAMVQLIEVINEVIKEMQENEELEGADLVNETVEVSPEHSK